MITNRKISPPWVMCLSIIGIFSFCVTIKFIVDFIYMRISVKCKNYWSIFCELTLIFHQIRHYCLHMIIPYSGFMVIYNSRCFVNLTTEDQRRDSPIIQDYWSNYFIMKFDDIIIQLGEFGTYQIRAYFLICLVGIPCGLHSLVVVSSWPIRTATFIGISAIKTGQ